MLKWLFARDVEDFAIGLALDFAKRFPPGAPESSRPAQLAQAVDEVCNRALEFHRQRRLGIYGKAKLGTAFKMQLKESGYPEPFVVELTQRLLIRLSARVDPAR